MKEPAFNKATEKQKMAFQRSFLKDPNSLSLGNSDVPVTELHAKRSELRKMAKGILDTSDKEKRSLTDSEVDAFDMCTLLLEDIQAAFDVKQERAFATNAITGASGATHRANALETWEEVGTGKKIPVLGKEDRFQDVYPRNGNEISARDFFSGMVNPSANSETRTAMSEASDGKGGYMLTPYVMAEVIDLLRAKNQVINAGARTIPLPAQDTSISHVLSDPTT